MKEHMKGKAFPFAPTGCSPPPFLLPYGSQGEAGGGGLPFLCVNVDFLPGRTSSLLYNTSSGNQILEARLVFLSKLWMRLMR